MISFLMVIASVHAHACAMVFYPAHPIPKLNDIKTQTEWTLHMCFWPKIQTTGAEN